MRLPTPEEINIAFHNMTVEEDMQREVPQLLDLIRSNSIFQGSLNGTLSHLEFPEVTLAPEVRNYLEGLFCGAMLFGLSMGLHIGEVQHRIRKETVQ